MTWEIREHMMGHKLKDRVREAYFLADPEELKKVYLRYIEHLSVKGSTGKYSLDEFRELQRQICIFAFKYFKIIHGVE